MTLPQGLRLWPRSLTLVNNLESLGHDHVRFACVSCLADWQRCVKRSRPGGLGGPLEVFEQSPVGLLPVHRATLAIPPGF